MSQTRLLCNVCGFPQIYCACNRSTPEPIETDKIESITGDKVEIILSEQIGTTMWQVFRAPSGSVLVVIRQPTGYIETSARNIEILLAKLVKLKIPYKSTPTSP
jgi:hypothetical protein